MIITGDPAFLREHFVTEIGTELTRPFVIFTSNADGADPAQVRLVIENAFTVTPVPPGSGTGAEDDARLWLLRLVDLISLTVQEARQDQDATLTITFYGGVRLRVEGRPGPWTMGDIWTLIALGPGGS